MYSAVETYLAPLPRGAASYPDCQVQTSIYDELRREVPPLDVRGMARLSPGFCAYVSHGTPDDWMPEVWASALLELWFVAACQGDEEAARARLRGVNSKLLERPAFRALVRVLSPSLALMSFARGWGLSRRGTTARSELGSRHDSPRTAGIIVGCPPHLFSERQVWGFEETFRIVSDLLKLRDHRVSPGVEHEEGLRFGLRWSER